MLRYLLTFAQAASACNLVKCQGSIVAQTLAHIIEHCISSVRQNFCSLSIACGLRSVTLSSLSRDSASPVLVSQISQLAMPLSLSMIVQSRSI